MREPTVGEVIGWKFDHQQGMATRDGVIVEFPGEIPTQADIDQWTAEYKQSPEWKGRVNQRDRRWPSDIERVEALWESIARGDNAKLNALKAREDTVNPPGPPGP